MDDEIAELKAQIAEQDANEKRFERLEAKIAEGAQENEQLKAKIASLEERGVRKSIVPPPRGRQIGAMAAAIWSPRTLKGSGVT